MINRINVGIVTDWLVTFAGSEKVVAEFINIFPDSELYAVIDFLKKEDKNKFLNKTIHTSFIQKLPNAKKLSKILTPNAARN